MHSALTLVIGSGMELKAGDFDIIWDRFRGHYWVTCANQNWIYSMAIEVNNFAVQEAWEKHEGFLPYRANNIRTSRYGGSGYLHTNSMVRQREKLAVGFGAPFDKRMWWVTRIGLEGVRFAAYKNDYPEGKPTKLRLLKRDEITALFPAPKKTKQQSTETST